MEKIVVTFEPLNKRVEFYILNSDKINEYISSQKISIEEGLSNRFKSKVYKFDDGRILEIRKFGLKEDGKIYNNLEELLFCRRIFTTIRLDNKRRVYDIKCSKEDVNYMISKYHGIFDDKLKEDTRGVIKLDNGQFMIIYRSGDGVLFNSLSDLQYISPFDSFDDDYENVFIDRETNLYIDGHLSIQVEVINNETAQKLKFSNDKTTTGFKLLQDNRFLEKINSEVFIIFKSVKDYETLNFNRKKNYSSDIILLNGKEDGIIIDKEKFISLSKECKNIIVNKLNINNNLLDYSIESLNTIDSLINKYLCDSYFVNEISASIILYVGEVLIQRSNGKWKFSVYEKSGFYKAFIELPNGNKIDFIPAIFNEFKNQLSTGDFASHSVITGMLFNVQN